jgi:hypothetical protein
MGRRRGRIGDVAVDGAFGHLQRVGQLAGGDGPTPVEEKDDLEQAVGSAHGGS